MRNKIQEKGGFWRVLSGFLVIVLVIVLILTLLKAIFAVSEARKAQKDMLAREAEILEGGDGLSQDLMELSEEETSVAEVLVEEAGLEADSLSEEYQVLNIVDGDTLDVLVDGTETRVRLIGVDTPETKDPNEPVGCFGEEATEYLEKKLVGKNVQLEKDESQDEVDKYGRLLRYVWSEGQNVNYLIIRNGFGFEYTFEEPYKYQREFRQAEFQARTIGVGLWKKCYQ